MTLVLVLKIGFDLLVLWKRKSRTPLMEKPGNAC